MIAAGSAQAAAVAKSASNAYGLSHFKDIPIFDINRPTYAAMFPLERSHLRKEGIHSDFQIAGYYTKSTDHDKNDRASYFLPNGLNKIVVGEMSSTVYENWTQDVYAQNFKIATAALGDTADLTYSATVNFAPETIVAGLGLAYVQNIKRFWFDLTMPVQYVSTDLGISYSDVVAGGGATPDGWYSTVQESWQSTDLQYGRFLPNASIQPKGLKFSNDLTSSKLHRFAQGDLTIRLGYHCVDKERLSVNGYIGAVAPTAPKYNPAYLWDPQVGLSQAAVMWGSTFNYLAHEFRNGATLRTVVMLNNRFNFSRKDLRSMDLIKNGPWSRYMQVWTSDAAFADGDSDTVAGRLVPLINYSTLEVKVSPRAAFDMNSGFVFAKGGFQAELGFNMYARHSEEIEIVGTLQSGLGIADVESIAAAGAFPADPLTAGQFGKIAGYIQPGTANAISDTDNTGADTYVALTTAELDPASCAAPGVLAYSIYGGLSYNRDCAKFPWFAGVGGTYTFASDNTAVNRWGIFGKVGMSL